MRRTASDAANEGATHGQLPDVPFSVPEGWAWDSLARGLRYRKTFIAVDDATEYRRVTVQLHGRGVTQRDVIWGVDIKTKEQQVVRGYDFLVAEIDAKMGGFGIVPPELDGAIVSSHYFTFEVEQSLLLPGYLEALVQTGLVTNEILRFVRGSLN